MSTSTRMAGVAHRIITRNALKPVKRPLVTAKDLEPIPEPERTYTGLKAKLYEANKARRA